MSGTIITTDLSMIAAVLTAPLMAVSKRWPTVAHAVTMEHVVEGWNRETYQSACGKTGLRLVASTTSYGISVPPWPPRVKGCPYMRCRECWVETGKKRPRSEWKPK